MTQFVMGADGVVQMLPDGAATDPISLSIQKQGMYQSPEGWAIVTSSPGGQRGGAPRIILAANGKQPPADILARFPMASAQDQQGFQQQAAKYDAESKNSETQSQIGFLTGMLGGAAGGYFGGAGATPAAASTGAFDMGGTAGALGAGASGASPAAAAIGGQLAPAALATGASPAASGAGSGISAGTALSGAGLAASVAGGGGDGVQAGVDAANSTSGYTQLDPAASAASPGGSADPTAALYNGLPAAAKTALGRILDGTGTPSDYASVLGAGGSALLGTMGSSQQQSQLKALSDQYIGMGAPSRARYEASFAPGFTLSSDPGYSDAIAQTAKASANALSVNGNPGQSPNAQIQNNMDIYSKTAYPALQQYRNQNAATGGIANFSAAAPETQQAAIGAGSNVFGAIGKGIANITSPPQTLSDWIAAQGAGSNIFKAPA